MSDIGANTWNEREQRIYDMGVAAGHSDTEADITILADKIQQALDGHEPREVGSAEATLHDIQEIVEGLT